MAKITLDEAWIYAGQVYGPGEAEMPDDVKKALGERGAFEESQGYDLDAEQAKADAAMQVMDGANINANSVTAAQVQDTNAVADPNPVAEALIEAVGGDLAYALRDAGFNSLTAIQSASDADLLKINGIGKARLEALRALKGQE